MELIDIIEDAISVIRDMPTEQLALLAVVTMVTAGIVYLLVDALRYRAIPDLNVPFTEGMYVEQLKQSVAAYSSGQALTADHGRVAVAYGCCCACTSSCNGSAPYLAAVAPTAPV